MASYSCIFERASYGEMPGNPVIVSRCKADSACSRRFLFRAINLILYDSIFASSSFASLHRLSRDLYLLSLHIEVDLLEVLLLVHFGLKHLAFVLDLAVQELELLDLGLELCHSNLKLIIIKMTDIQTMKIEVSQYTLTVISC